MAKRNIYWLADVLSESCSKQLQLAGEKGKMAWLGETGDPLPTIL
jgi:hypothetical protein